MADTYTIRQDEFGDWQVLWNEKHVSWHPTLVRAVEKLGWIAAAEEFAEGSCETCEDSLLDGVCEGCARDEAARGSVG
jgi:hypothetical protein